jgi:hypothetical protein
MRLTVIGLVIAACATTPPPTAQSESDAAQRELLSRRRMAWRLTRRALRAPDCSAALAYEEQVRLAGRESYALFAKALSACLEERERTRDASGPVRDAAHEEIRADAPGSSEMPEGGETTTAVEAAPLVWTRCVHPVYFEPSILVGIGGASSPSLLRLTGGARLARCEQRRIGRDLHVGLVFEAQPERGLQTSMGLELRTSWPLDEDGALHLGPRLGVVSTPFNFNDVGLWLGARLETGPLTLGIDVLHRATVERIGMASTGVFAVLGLRDKPGTVATEVISVTAPVAIIAFWTFLALVL